MTLLRFFERTFTPTRAILKFFEDVGQGKGGLDIGLSRMGSFRDPRATANAASPNSSSSGTDTDRCDCFCTSGEDAGGGYSGPVGNPFDIVESTMP